MNYKAFTILALLVLRPIWLSAQSADSTKKRYEATRSFLSAKIRYNYKNCPLTVKADNWISNGAKIYLPVVVTMSNNSDDTLRYQSELCFKGIFMGSVEKSN